MPDEKVERLINQPKEFWIGSKSVFVEAHPPGAVTLIIKKIIDKIRLIDLAVIKSEIDDGNIESIYELFGKRMDKATAEDYQLFRMILTPAETWRRTRGNLKDEDYSLSIDELEWGATEQQLDEIFDEWSTRNPRFALQKKISGLTVQ